MILFENEIILTSELYGEICLVDGAYIRNYPQLDQGWIEPPAAKPDVTKLLNDRNKELSSILWNIDVVDNKKINVMSFEAFSHFPNHIEISLESDTLFTYTRLNPLYKTTQKGIVCFFISKYIHWNLRNKPNLYFYTYGDFSENKNNITYCATQTSFLENALVNKSNLEVANTYVNYDDSGNNLLLLKHNPENTYNKFNLLLYIDDTLHNSVLNVINGV